MSHENAIDPLTAKGTFHRQNSESSSPNGSPNQAHKRRQTNYMVNKKTGFDTEITTVKRDPPLLQETLSSAVNKTYISK
jgi:hypothetical protein